MPSRTIYVTDEMWQRVNEFANDKNRSVSEVIRTAVMEYIDKTEDMCPKCEAIRVILDE